jgi:hypothetical protein
MMIMTVVVVKAWRMSRDLEAAHRRLTLSHMCVCCSSHQLQPLLLYVQHTCSLLANECIALNMCCSSLQDGLWRCNFCGIECSGSEVQWQYTGTATLINCPAHGTPQLHASCHGLSHAGSGMQMQGQGDSVRGYRVPGVPLGPAAASALTTTTAEVWAALSAKERSRRAPWLNTIGLGEGSQAVSLPKAQSAAGTRVPGSGIKQGPHIHVSQLTPCLGQEPELSGQCLWLACLAWA